VEAKELEAAGDWMGALHAYTSASSIFTTSQISNKIEKLKSRLSTQTTASSSSSTTTTAPSSAPDSLPATPLDGAFSLSSSGTCVLPGGFTLAKDLYEKMFPHQRKGVEWLWSLHTSGSGGVLGDDMVRMV
jgi:SNF2 family DNA or RNA helicase